jgi:hypothetical protein
MKFKMMNGPALWVWLFLLVGASCQYLLGLGGYIVADTTYAGEIWLLLAAAIFAARSQRGSYVSLFFIFQICTFLFLGGRLFALSLGFDIDGGAFDLDFMANYIATPEIKNSTFYYVVLLIVGTNIGYCTSLFKSAKMSDRTVLDWRLVLVLVVLLAIPSLVGLKERVISAFMNGYESTYASQSADYSAGGNAFQAAFSAAIALCFATRKRLVIVLAILLMVVQSIAGLAIGGRGQFLTIMATFLWLYGRNRKVNLLKLAGVFVLLGVATNVLLGFSARATGLVSHGILDGLVNSLNEQGVSLGVFAYSLNVSHYPISAYFQELIPGTSVFASILTGQPLKATDLSFAAYLSSVANVHRFNMGNGLGWSMAGDIYLFSMGIVPIYFLLCFAFGRFLSFLDTKAGESTYWFALALALAPRIFFLPRSSFAGVIPFLPYFMVAFWLVKRLGTTRADNKEAPRNERYDRA